MENNLDVKIVYVGSYYDFPLSGIGQIDEQRVLFELNNDWEDYPPVYDIYSFDDPYIEENHLQFEQRVGTHWCRHLPKSERIFHNKPDWHDYFDERKNKPSHKVEKTLMGQAIGPLKPLCPL